MIPLNLTLRNCRTFENLELNFDAGLIALLGSNGAGKSTVVNAIDVALFGPEGRSLADWYPRQGGQDALQIELVFDHDGETFRVRRTFSPKGRGASKTDLERLVTHGRIGILTEEERVSHEWEPLTVESQSETTAQIEALIGLTRDTFRASSFLAEGETGRFCEAQPRQRKQVLSEVIGLADWDPILERARTEKRAVESELDQIAGKVDQAEGELQERSLIEEELAEARKRETETQATLDQCLAALASAREALAEERAKVERRSGAQKALQDADERVKMLKAQIDAREIAISGIDARLAKRDQLQNLVALLPELREERETLRALYENWGQHQRLTAEAERLAGNAKTTTAKALELERRAISALEHVGDDTCDRCGQTLHEDAAKRAAQSYRDEASGLQAQALEAQDEAARLRDQIAELDAKEPTDVDRKRAADLPEMIRVRENAVPLLAELDEAERHRAVAVEEVEKMRAELPERALVAADARAGLDALGPHDPSVLPDREQSVWQGEQAIEAQRRLLSTAERDIARHETQLARLDKLAETITEATRRRDELHAEHALLANMERAAGPNGVPALILENVAIPQIEAEASRILARLGGPAYAVELRTLREKKTGGISDTLDVVCLTHEGDRPYESFSTGEKARIAFALRLALAQLLASRKGSSSGLLVIDEIHGLDPVGVAALVEVLEELQRQVPLIIVVSHAPELRDAFETAIVVENVDGRSRSVEAAEFASAPEDLPALNSYSSA